MKLKTFVKEIEIVEYNTMAEIFLNDLYESFSKEFEVPLMEDITTNCVYKTHSDGTKGSNGIETSSSDDELKKRLSDIKAGTSQGWERVMNKSSCLQSIVAQLSGQKADCTPVKNCEDIKKDNNDIRKKVLIALTQAHKVFKINADKMGGMAKKGANIMLDLLSKEINAEYKVDELKVVA